MRENKIVAKNATQKILIYIKGSDENLKKAILVLCLTMLLTACGSNGSSNDSSSGTTTTTTITASTVEKSKQVIGSIAEVKKSTTTVTEATTPEPEKPKMTDDEINALACKEIGYGQGRNVDDKNKPVGGIAFQTEYGKYDAYAMVDTNKKEIYLSFDQGYENGYTAKILDTLKEKNAKAIFFLTGDYAKRNPDLVKRMIDEGHVLGNHGAKHKSLPLLSIADAETEIMSNHQYVLDNFGYDMKYFRPPCGTYSEKSLAITQRCGYKSFLWSFAYADWDPNNQPNEEEAYKRITEAAHDGEIMLLHSVSKTNSDILGRVIDNLQEKGYTLTTPSI